MKGRVMFWFYLDQSAGAGFVYFRLYGQRCSKCNDPEFTHAMWYPEEVLKVGVMKTKHNLLYCINMHGNVGHVLSCDKRGIDVGQALCLSVVKLGFIINHLS